MAGKSQGAQAELQVGREMPAARGRRIWLATGERCDDLPTCWAVDGRRGSRRDDLAGCALYVVVGVLQASRAVANNAGNVLELIALATPRGFAIATAAVTAKVARALVGRLVARGRRQQTTIRAIM